MMTPFSAATQMSTLPWMAVIVDPSFPEEAADRKDLGKGRLRDAHEDEGIRGQTEVRLTGVDARLYDGIGVLELVDIHDGAAQERGVVRILDAHLAHHLADDDLDVAVVDIDALLAVHGQNALRQIFRTASTPEMRSTSCGLSAPSVMGSPLRTRSARPSGRRNTGPDRA